MNELIALICPQCSGQISREKSETGTKCPYCGTEILMKDAMVAESIDRLGSTVKSTIRSEAEEQRRMSVYNHLKLCERCFHEHRFDEFHERGSELMKLDSSEEICRLKTDLEHYAVICCSPVLVSEVLIFAAKMLGICLIAGIVLLFLLGSVPVLNCVPLLLPFAPVAYVIVRLKQKKENEKLLIALHGQIERRFSALKESFAPVG